MAQPMSQSRTVTAYSGIDCWSLGGRWLMTEALRGIFKLVTYRQRYPSLMRLLYHVGCGDGDESKGIHEQNLAYGVFVVVCVLHTAGHIIRPESDQSAAKFDGETSL